MRLLSSKCCLLAALVCLSPTSQAWAQFDVDFNVDSSNLTADETASLNASLSRTATFWEQYIVGFQPGVSNDLTGITLDVSASPDDGPGGTLASAGPTGFGFNSGGFTFAVAAPEGGFPNPITRLSGAITIDSDDLGFGQLDDVLNHEVAHALGFGTLWDFGLNDVYVEDSGQYTGAFGLETFQQEFGSTDSFIPIELDGAPGTRNGHFNERASFGAQEDALADLNGPAGAENDPGDIGPAFTVQSGIFAGRSLDTELLTGRINGPSTLFLSDSTVATFADIGFEVVLPSQVAAAIPEPSSLALFGIAAFAVVTRRRR